MTKNKMKCFVVNVLYFNFNKFYKFTWTPFLMVKFVLNHKTQIQDKINRNFNLGVNNVFTFIFKV